MDQKLISNQVFYEPQVPTYDTVSTTGIIRYANRFSGLNPVPISPEYAKVLNSDSGEVGNSILVQLEQKIQGLPNGPWFMDSMDDVIYIHNRKFLEKPSHTFIYQQENGELLDISFQTQYITKRLEGTVSTGIGPDKVLNMDVTKNKVFGDYLLDEDFAEKSKTHEAMMATANLASAYADYSVGKLSKSDLESVEEYYRKLGYTDSEQHDLSVLEHERRVVADNEAADQAKRAEVAEAYKMYQADKAKHGSIRGANKEWHDREVEKILTESNLDQEVERIIVQVTGGSQTHKDWLIREMRENAKRGELEKFMKSYFGATHHALDEAAGNTNPNPYQIVTIRPATYVKNYEKRAAKAKNMATGHAENMWRQMADEGLENMKKDPNILIVDDSFKYTYGVRVFKKVETVGIVSQYQILHAYYTRKYGSGPTGSWEDVERRINEAGNKGKRITERKLVCNMTCIGNPQLQSSQVVNILNVGKKWSGIWYIKSCTHQLTPGQGYTCIIELVKNLNNNPVTSSALGLGTKELASANMSENGSDVVVGEGDTKTRFTQAEMIWFWDQYTDPDGNGGVVFNEAAGEEAVMTLLAGKAKSDWHSRYGVVQQRVNTTSSGENVKYTYQVDPTLKITTEEKQAQGRIASSVIKELKKQAEENKGK